VNAAVAIHTAARRYCLDQYREWCERYAELLDRGRDRQRDGYHYTAEALAIFPRYNVLNAIRIEVERLDPDRLSDFGETRAQLLRAGESANDAFTQGSHGPIETRAIAEERAAYGQFVAGLEQASLDGVEPLPYRRVLQMAESEALWSGLGRFWEVPRGGCWYPLASCSLAGIVAFDAPAFARAIRLPDLRLLLASRTIRRVWELREYGPEITVDLELFDPQYNGAEGYWSSEPFDWIIYASHEGSVTVGGWLLDGVQSCWPSWARGVWRGVA